MATMPLEAGAVMPDIGVAAIKKEDEGRIDSDRIPTPPTSEDMNKNEHQHEGNSSDLSDLEDDEEELEVKPDHYWDEENGGRIPVFKPTMSQFRDFSKFIAAIDSYGMKSGIVKVVPPPEWHDSLGRLDEAIKSIRVKNPITQEFAGTHGTYTQANIEKQRSYNLPQWKSLCEESNHKTPARKGDRRREADAAKAARPARAAANADGTKRKPGRPKRSAVKEEDVAEESVEVPPTPTSPNRGEDDEAEEEKTETKTRGRVARGKPGPKPKAKPAGRQPKAAKDVKKSVASRRLHNSAETWEVDEEAFDDFDYHLSNVDQFDPDRCRELEETYWKTINFGTPMYGADMPGSLFSDDVTSWNVAHLPNLLDVLGTKVPGVNTAYLYLGMWKATFAWHLEDVDLYSINYIHFGAPKQWYSISQADARKFEIAMRSLWPQDYKHCDQFLRHKTYLISPEKLKSQFGIKVNKLVHYEGEFVITYPYGYHSGFNLGYNCAESVNFATSDWLNYGKIAKKCLCEEDSVWIDINEIERKLRGEPTPEYDEVTDSEASDEEEVLPTPPPSVKGSKTASKKRKRPTGGKSKKDEPEKKKLKKVKIRLHPKSKEPCMLCPNEASYDDLLPTDNGKHAHRLCALYTPETFIKSDPSTEDATPAKSQEMVCNVSHIEKARLDMRCNFCRSKKGSVFQCASKKCTRAFHATCAAAAGVLVDEGPVPTWDENGTEYWFDGFDFRCRFHRPRRPKNSDGKGMERLEDDRAILRYARNVKQGEVVQAQLLEGDIFAGVVVENRAAEGMVLLRDIFDQPTSVSAHVEVEHKYLLLLDPAQSQRPKPSPDAKPLPENLTNSKDHSAENRRDGVPSEGDPFLDPAAEQVWEEFNSVHAIECSNPFQKKVDITSEVKPGGKVGMWHFLGRTSTEARPQFTHDHAVQVNNPKSNFLESVREAEGPRYTPVQQRAPGYGGYGSYAPYGSAGGQLAPRPPVQLQPRPSAASGSGMEMKPYEYKPKTATSPTNVYAKGIPYQKWQVNTSSSYGQAQAQTAQMYPRYGAPVAQQNQGFRPLQTWSALPPQKSTTPPGGPSYSPPSTHAPQQPPPNGTSSFYQQAERQYSRQPSYPATHNTPTPRPQTNPGAKAVTKSATTEYIQHIGKYPYLRNSYTRRPEKYSSPYSSGGFGFAAEYEMKLQRGITARGLAVQARREMEMRALAQGANAVSNVNILNNGVGVKVEGQHQSPQDFQGSIRRESGGGVNGNVQAGPGWGELLSRIGPGNAGTSNVGVGMPPGASCSPYGVTAFAPMEQGVRRDSAGGGAGGEGKGPEYSPISGRASPALNGLGISGAMK